MVAEYPADTRLVDEGVRFEVQFDSADKTLDDELALDDVLDNSLLLFAGTEILSEELFKMTPTYQNGAPTTVIGPPTSGERVLGQPSSWAAARIAASQ